MPCWSRRVARAAAREFTAAPRNQLSGGNRVGIDTSKAWGGAADAAPRDAHCKLGVGRFSLPRCRPWRTRAPIWWESRDRRTCGWRQAGDRGPVTVGQLIALTCWPGAWRSHHAAGHCDECSWSGMSVQRLGDILNAPTKLPAPKAACRVAGRITFDQVRFATGPTRRSAQSISLAHCAARSSAVGAPGRARAR